MSETATDWSKPQPVEDVLLAFPARVAHLMPPREECEQALHEMPDRGRGWIEFQQRWFYEGLSPDTEFELREGVDPATALRHLKAIQGSFEPKHEHKEAAVAYLASLWFEAPPAPVRAEGDDR